MKLLKSNKAVFKIGFCMKILILEETQQQANILSNILLGGFGLNADIAESISHAHDLISRNKYTIFFFNVVYFKSEGIFFFSKLEKGQVPLSIMVTSVGHADINGLICDMCLVAGFEIATYARKPIDISTVESLLLQVLSKREQVSVSSQNVLLSKDEVNEGVEKGYFLNYYQPQYCTVNNSLVSVEALIRLKHPKFGVLSPASFMNSFDVDRLFWWVLERSLIDINRLDKKINLSVNINQRTLKSPISERILLLCHSYGFNPSRLTLELTEDEAFDPGVVSLANLTALRLVGVGLAIDDFGTGHSSLSQLVTLPYTELKIDQKFVSSLIKNFKSRQVLATSLFLAKSLNMKSVAEGVENQETLSYLSSSGVDLYQGYFGSKPISIDELKKLLSTGFEI